MEDDKSLEDHVDGWAVPGDSSRCKCTGWDDCAGREFGGGWSARDSGFAGGDGGAVWVVSDGDAGGLESGGTRDADRDAIRGCSPTTSCEDTAGRAAAAYVFFGCSEDWAISSEWRRLHCVHEGY